MMRLRFTVMLAALFACAGILSASYLESDHEKKPPEEEPPRRILPPEPLRPVLSNPLTELIGRATVLDGYSWRGLTVFPVELSRVGDATDYLSVAEALRKNLLVVREKGEGNVPVLVVENRGNGPVLMLGGELLLGGKQNRVLREDVLLAPRSGPVEVPVFCIEQGRWTHKSDAFESRLSVAPLAVREAAQAGGSQDAVWSGVASYQRSLKVESATGDLQAVHDSPAVRKALAEYTERFDERCWRREQVGMVVARHGRIVGADLFASAALFRKHRDRLLESYALDCIAHESRREDAVWRAPDRNAAEQFLRIVYRSDFAWRNAAGLGRFLVASGAGLSGQSLVYWDNVLHAYLAAREVVVIHPPHPVPRPVPIPIEPMLPED